MGGGVEPTPRTEQRPHTTADAGWGTPVIAEISGQDDVEPPADVRRGIVPVEASRRDLHLTRISDKVEFSFPGKTLLIRGRKSKL